MHPVRVLFGALPETVYAAFVEAISSQQDMAVVGVVSRPTSLLVEAGRLAADIVVVATVDQALPGVASHLLDQYPHITVVAVTADVRQAQVCVLRPYVEHIAVASPADLVRAMRSPGEPRDG